MRGRKTPEKEKPYFYFVELPCRFYFMKGRGWKKFNLFNWPDKEHSDRFQVLVLGWMLDKHPKLFDLLPEQEKTDE